MEDFLIRRTYSLPHSRPVSEAMRNTAGKTWNMVDILTLPLM